MMLVGSGVFKKFSPTITSKIVSLEVAFPLLIRTESRTIESAKPEILISVSPSRTSQVTLRFISARSEKTVTADAGQSLRVSSLVGLCFSSGSGVGELTASDALRDLSFLSLVFLGDETVAIYRGEL